MRRSTAQRSGCVHALTALCPGRRARLSYEHFSRFLQIVKELNAGNHTRDETLRKAKELFGAANADLYSELPAAGRAPDHDDDDAVALHSPALHCTWFLLPSACLAARTRSAARQVIASSAATSGLVWRHAYASDMTAAALYD
jgi:hypothetical protein